MSCKKSVLSNIFICYVKNGFYACLVCAATGLSATLTVKTSCILYFFGLGKYTKKSLWSHISALFWLSKHEKIAEALVVSISLNWTRIDIYLVYV